MVAREAAHLGLLQRVLRLAGAMLLRLAGSPPPRSGISFVWRAVTSFVWRAARVHSLSNCPPGSPLVRLGVKVLALGVSAGGVRLLRSLSRLAGKVGHRDGTAYGTARTSTSSFFVHHLSALSRALATSDALTLLNAAATNDFLTTSPIRFAA